MTIHERLKKPLGLTAIGAIGFLAINNLKNIMPNFGTETQTDIGKIEAEHTVSDIRNVEKIMLTESEGQSKVTVHGRLHFEGGNPVQDVFAVGKNAISNLPGLKPGKITTEVETHGILQLGLDKGGLHIPAKPNTEGMTEVTVDTDKLLLQQVLVESKQSKTKTDDGVYVNLRRVFDETEANVDGRADGAEAFARISYSNQCSNYTKAAFPGSVVAWVQSQRPDLKERRNIKLIDQDGQPLDMTKVQLPQDELKSAEQKAIDTIQGSGDNISIQDIIPGRCKADSKISDKIAEINKGVQVPTPEPVNY